MGAKNVQGPSPVTFEREQSSTRLRKQQRRPGSDHRATNCSLLVGAEIHSVHHKCDNKV